MISFVIRRTIERIWPKITVIPRIELPRQLRVIKINSGINMHDRGTRSSDRFILLSDFVKMDEDHLVSPRQEQPLFQPLTCCKTHPLSSRRLTL